MAKRKNANKRKGAVRPKTTKRRATNPRGKTVRVLALTHPARPGVKPKARGLPGGNARSAAAGPALAEVTAVTAVAVKEQFKTVQIKNVPADEVDALIAEETATRDVVSVQKHDEGDGEYTVVFVYREG
jgi:hypothetical protein